MKDRRKVTLTPLSPKEVYDDQCKLEGEMSEAENNKKNSENPKGKIWPKEKTKANGSFMARESEVRHALHSNQMLFIVTYKDAYNDMDVTKLDDGLDGEDNKKMKDKAKDPLSMP